MNLSKNTQLIDVLTSGGVAVIRTDTLYGIVASANDHQAVERVYAIKDRDLSKSCIILIDVPEKAYSHPAQLEHDIELYHGEPTSFLIESKGAPEWLLRQNTELAYRVPASPDLRALLAKTGPLIAPSANPEGLPPAKSIEEARDYFGDKVDVYIDGGTVPDDTLPSRLLRIKNDGSTERLR